MKTDVFTKARDFAILKHGDQKRDNGDPYFVHCSEVADIIWDLTKDDNLTIAAYLHDTIEDTDATYEEIKKEFGVDVADLVNEVTHEGKKDSHGFYFPRLKTKRGIILKFADRLHNLSDMNAWDDKRQEHFLKKSKFWKSDSPKSKTPALRCKRCQSFLYLGECQSLECSN